MRFETETGSVYELKGSLVRRVNGAAEKRGDGSWLLLLNTPDIKLGSRAELLLEPLDKLGPDDEGNLENSGAMATWRTTSIVVGIYDD